MQDKEFPELTEAEKVRWAAATSDMRELSVHLREGTASNEEALGALNRLASCDVDRDKLLNSLHVPADAGKHADALGRILRRIPDGWGRWISLDAGWYPLVATLDEQLAGIDPDYVVHQVKEKLGGLRYYCQPSEARRSALWAMFRDIITAAEQVAEITCERCGEPGILHDRNRWLKTLCASCAESLGYRPAARE